MKPWDHRYLETETSEGPKVSAVLFPGHLSRADLDAAGKKAGFDLTDAALDAAHHAEMAIEGENQDVTVVPAGLT